MTFRQNHLRHGAHCHQNNRDQRGPDADAKAWHLFFSEGFCAVQTFRDWLINAFQETCVYRTGENNGRDCQNRTKQQGFTHICVENGGNSGWTRVRWQEAVRYGQCRSHWHANVQQRDVGSSGNGEHQRQHQYETNFVEQGKTNGEAG